MNRAAAWSVRGVGRETRDIAEEAARRAGMSLGDWLDEVVAEQAADQGVSVDDLDEDDKLDAIGDRLSRLSRHPAAVRRDAGEERRAPRPERKRSGEEARRTHDLLETAEDERDDDKLDAIADRLSRLSSRERAMAANRPGAGNDGTGPAPRTETFGGGSSTRAGALGSRGREIRNPRGQERRAHGEGLRIGRELDRAKSGGSRPGARDAAVRRPEVDRHRTALRSRGRTAAGRSVSSGLARPTMPRPTSTSG